MLEGNTSHQMDAGLVTKFRCVCPVVDFLMTFQHRLSCMSRSSHRSVHDPRKPDREGRAAAGLALDRDVAAHHLAEALADREPKAGAAVFARRRCVGLGELL